MGLGEREREREKEREREEIGKAKAEAIYEFLDNADTSNSSPTRTRKMDIGTKTDEGD